MTFRFDSLAAFAAMDGHGVFVWASYGISIAAMVWLVINPLLRRRAIMAELARQQQRLQLQSVEK